MNDFHDLDAAVSGAIDGAYAEAAVHLPRVSAQYVERRPDPDRSHHLIHGVFAAALADTRSKAQRAGLSPLGRPDDCPTPPTIPVHVPACADPGPADVIRQAASRW